MLTSLGLGAIYRNLGTASELITYLVSQPPDEARDWELERLAATVDAHIDELDRRAELLDQIRALALRT